jgi:hypothetical protein
LKKSEIGWTVQREFRRATSRPKIQASYLRWQIASMRGCSDGFLFGEGVKTTLKKQLLEEFNLHTIVRLPKGVFSPYTSINTNLLFFEKGGPTKVVWFYNQITKASR